MQGNTVQDKEVEEEEQEEVQGGRGAVIEIQEIILAIIDMKAMWEDFQLALCSNQLLCRLSACTAAPRCEGATFACSKEGRARSPQRDQQSECAGRRSGQAGLEQHSVVRVGCVWRWGQCTRVEPWDGNCGALHTDG